MKDRLEVTRDGKYSTGKTINNTVITMHAAGWVWKYWGKHVA